MYRLIDGICVVWLIVARILVVLFCGTHLSVGQLWHESYCGYSVARSLLASQPAKSQNAGVASNFGTQTCKTVVNELC